MTRSILVPLAAAVVAVSLGVSLASCGRQSDLERPAPLWGEKAKAEYRAQQQAAAAAQAKGDQDNQTEPLPEDNAVTNQLDAPAAARP